MSRLGGSGDLLRQGSTICEGMLCAASHQAPLASEVGIGGRRGARAHSARLRDRGHNLRPAHLPDSGQGVYAALLDLDGAKPATAPRGDDAFSALAGFAQTVAVESKTAGPATSGQRATASSQDDAVFAELAEFAQRVGARRSVSQAPRLKLADADNAIDALQEFLRGNGKPAPVAAPGGGTRQVGRSAG